MTDKKMTVDEFYLGIKDSIQMCIKFPETYNGINWEILQEEFESFIQAQREQAVEEYRLCITELWGHPISFWKELLIAYESSTINGTELIQEIYSLRDNLKALELAYINKIAEQAENPTFGWLPITDEQKDGNSWLVGAWVNGVWEKSYSDFDRQILKSWQAGCGYLGCGDYGVENPTHYLPIDKLPLPDKPEMEGQQGE